MSNVEQGISNDEGEAEAIESFGPLTEDLRFESNWRITNIQQGISNSQVRAGLSGLPSGRGCSRMEAPGLSGCLGIACWLLSESRVRGRLGFVRLDR
jgi:hypothetical protein